MNNLCNNCIHKDVCGRYAATWGMKSCGDFMEMPKFEPKTIITLHGYNAEALVLIAEMLWKKLITEDELDNFFKDFVKMYEIIIREQKTIISETMATFQWPSLGETVQMMWVERNIADMRGNEDG